MTGGIPGLTIVGMPDHSVLEARQRIRCAITRSGFEMPRMHITVNLSPGDMQKSGTGFDLPIAVAILCASGQIDSSVAERALFFGELGLDGDVKAVRGTVAYAILARRLGLPVASADIPGLVGEGFETWGFRSLSDLLTGPRQMLADESRVCYGHGLGRWGG